jgi:putative ABC transport system permease protein
MRQALGAGQGRLIRQLLTESVLLSVAGGAGGLLLLAWTQGLLVRAMPGTLPRLNPAQLDWSVLLFAVFASLATGVGFGIVPALHFNRVDPGQVLKQSDGRGTSSRHAGTRRVLIVAEFAISLVLLAGAGLLVRTFHDLVNVELGFDRRNVIIIRTRLPDPNDPSADRYRNAAKEAPFLREVLRRGRTLPGVEDAAIGDTASIPLDETERDLKVISEGSYFIAIEGRPSTVTAPFAVERSSVTPEFFGLLHLRLLRGRVFNDDDDEKAPMVAVVNDAFARTYFPGEDPLENRFRSTRTGSHWVSVIGTIANARTESLADGSVPKIYLNFYQTGGKRLAIFLRGRLDPAATAERMRAEVQTVDSTLPVSGARTLDDTVRSSLDGVRFSMATVSLFALTALSLAPIGIYGVMAYVVGGRTREIGIRVALGAQRSAIVGSILREGLQLTIMGAAVGLGCALIATRLIAGVLYGVSPTDPATFLVVLIALLVVALLACVLPVRRATRIDPTIALRQEG